MMSRKRLTAADASLIWAHYQAAGGSAAKAIRRPGTIPKLYIHPKHHTKWTAEQKAQAAQMISMNPGLALGEVVIEALQEGLLRIGLSPEERYLNVLLITRKRNMTGNSILSGSSRTSTANLSTLTNSGSGSDRSDGSGERHAARCHAASLR
jgi:hypothetical protein